MTHKLTRNRTFPCGDHGINRIKEHPVSERTASNRGEWVRFHSTDKLRTGRPGARIPRGAPAQKFPPPFRFRLRRKLHSGGNFFAFRCDSLRWTRGGRGSGEPEGAEESILSACSGFFQKSERTYFAATPLPTGPAVLGSGWVLDATPKAEALKVGTCSKATEIHWIFVALFCTFQVIQFCGIRPARAVTHTGAWSG